MTEQTPQSGESKSGLWRLLDTFFTHTNHEQAQKHYEHIFDDDTNFGRENNEIIDRLYDKFGEKFVNEQFGKMATDPVLHGNLTGGQKKEGCHPGAIYSLPALLFLARQILQPQENIGNYANYIYGIDKIAKKIDNQMGNTEQRDHLNKHGVPSPEKMEELAKPYIENFRNSKANLNAAASRKAEPEPRH